MCSHVGLLGELDLSKALAGTDHVLVLDTHDTTAPVFSKLIILVVLFTELLGEGVQVLQVLTVDLSHSDAGSGLHVAELTEGSLSAEEAVWNLLLSAESWQVNNGLNWVDVMSDDHELGLTLFDKGGNVVKTELKVDWLGGFGVLVLSLGLESELLLLLGLWLVLAEESQELTGLGLINSLGELVDGWRDLKSLEEDSLLSLDADILWPFDETGEVLLLDDVSTNTEVSWVLLEEGSLSI